MTASGYNTHCAVCGTPLPVQATGRPRVRCVSCGRSRKRVRAQSVPDRMYHRHPAPESAGAITDDMPSPAAGWRVERLERLAAVEKYENILSARKRARGVIP